MAQSAIASIPALKEVYTQLKGRMDRAVEDFRANLAAARTGRATVHMLDPVRVPYYGSEMPLNQVATVHAPESQLLTVQPYDPSIMNEIEKTGQSAFITKHGRFVAIITPLAAGQVESRVLAEMAREIGGRGRG